MSTWLEVFSLDFTIFRGAQLRLWTSIWTGLLVPPWLVWMFDGSWREKFADLTFTGDYDGDDDDNIDGNNDFETVVNYCCPCCSTAFVALAVAGTAAGWYESVALDTLFFVLSVLYIFEWIIWR